MRFFYFNFGKAVPERRDIHTLIPAMIFSQDTVIYSADTANLTEYMEPELFNKYPKMMFFFYKSFYALIYGEEHVNTTVNNLEQGYKWEKKSMRTAAEQKAVIAYKRVFNLIRERVYDYMKWSLETHHLDKLNSYLKAGLIAGSNMKSVTNNGDDDERNTDGFIHILKQAGEYIILNEYALQFADCTGINEAPVEKDITNGIVKLADINLPGCGLLKYSKLQLLRDEINSQMNEWQLAADKLQEELSELKWNVDSIGLIREKINEGYLPATAHLQNAINDSIYFNQLEQGEWGHYKGTLMAAVCNRSTLLKLLRETGQVSAYNFQILSDYYSARDLADSPNLFFIHSVAEYPDQVQDIKHEEINPRWEASFQ